MYQLARADNMDKRSAAYCIKAVLQLESPETMNFLPVCFPEIHPTRISLEEVETTDTIKETGLLAWGSLRDQ